jgi:hypothetical protein
MVGCEKQTSRITEEHVVHAAGQLGQEIPKGKIKGERSASATAASSSSRRSLILGGIAVALVALIAAVMGFAGNPLDPFSAAPSPPAPKTPLRRLPPTLAALPASADLPATPMVPPPIPGSFSIVIGTYDNAREAQKAEAALLEQKLAPYQVDILMAPADLQRRILLGRYATREEAEAARQKLGPAFASARVIPGAQERLRVLIP